MTDTSNQNGKKVKKQYWSQMYYVQHRPYVLYLVCDKLLVLQLYRKENALL